MFLKNFACVPAKIPREVTAMKKRQKRPFLIKLISTIGLLICVPVLLMQFFTAWNAYQKIGQEKQSFDTSTSGMIASQFFAQLDTLQDLARATASDSSVLRFVNSGTPYSVYMAKESLQTLKGSIPIAEKVGLYYKGGDMVLCNKYAYPLEQFCQVLGGFDDGKSRRLLECFRTEQAGTQFFSTDSLVGDRENASLFVFLPVHVLSYSEFDGVVFYELPHRQVTDSLYAATFSDQWDFVLTQEGGNVLYSNLTDASLLDDADFESFLSGSGKELPTVTWSNSQYAGYRWEDPSGRLTFFAILSQSEYQKNVSEFYRSMIRVLLVTALCTVLLLALTVYINYAPLNRLVKQMPKDDSWAGELAGIESHLVDLDRQFSDQKLQFMDCLLGAMLFGAPVNRRLIQAVMPEKSIRSICVVSADCANLDNRQAIVMIQRLQEETGWQTFITGIPDKPFTIFIVVSSGELWLETLRERLEEALDQCLDQVPRLGFGEILTDISQIQRSYLSSQHALETLVPQQTPDREETLKQNTDLFLQALGDGDEDGVRRTLARSFDVIRSALSLSSERYHCYRLLISFLNYLEANGLPLSGEERESLFSFSAAGDLQEMLLKKAEALCRERARPDSTQELCRNMVRYIDENLSNPDLCLLEIAEHFSQSIYIVSRMLKNYLGIGFKEYLSAKRVQYAANLLRGTRYSVTRIAEMAGFSNAAYFSNVFKAQYGTSPNAYRKQGAESEER